VIHPALLTVAGRQVMQIIPRLPHFLCASVLILSLCGWQSWAGQADPRFRGGVDLVTVDVVVVDRSGTPVQGLTRADFAVLEDGRPQQIREFQSVELPAFAPTPAAPDLRRGTAPDVTGPPPAISTNSAVAGRIAGRAFVLVYDDVNLTRQQGAEARRAVRTFL
jgi:VWFA-related protein